MNTPKAKLEYNVTIRLASGDTSTVSVSPANRIHIGSVTMDLAEIEDFQTQLGEAVKAAKRINENPA